MNLAQLEDLYVRLRAKADIRDHRLRLVFSRPHCCTGSSLVDVLVQQPEFGVADRAQAVQVLQQLVQHRALRPVAGGSDGQFADSAEVLFRFLADEDADVFNRQFLCLTKPASTVDLSAVLRKSILRLYGEFLSDDGRQVDYARMRDSLAFHDYARASAQLQRAEVHTLGREERIAFFLNCYNALMVHVTAVRGTPTSMLARLAVFRTAAYDIGGQRFALDDMEHGVLRGNRKPPGALFRRFGRSDPRAALAVDPPDPRIHFALVCGARSCPSIRVYTAERLEAGLDDAARSFLSSELAVDTERGVVHLSRILQWYRADFPGDTDLALLHWLRRYLSDGHAAQLDAVLRVPSAVRIVWREYDWTSNAKM